ncbi:hypothetical protein [Burkholderia pseudomultivorans]|uniref:hypothetical protein n=1 Tax=Burkholderia pseudomultivorans TaxID=1207504 RepID=UPI0012DA2868|nr:hypothetical protein [Burkholderia pseudomultivorans]
MTNTTNQDTPCLCIGGPLHGHAFAPGFAVSASLTYRTADLVARDPSHYVEYTRKMLTRTVDGQPQSRDFFVLATRMEAGKVLVRGLSDEAALAATQAAPDDFWK